METEKKFKTKTGYCHILQDKIVITRDGIIGNVSKVIFGNGLARSIVIYAAIAIFMLYSAFKAYQESKVVTTFFYFGVAMLIFYKLKQSNNYSTTSIIERTKIKNVKFVDAKYGATRSRFEVLFEDPNGEIKTRLILLPGSLNDGENETNKALEIMKSEKLFS